LRYRSAVSFLVHEVAPAANGLCQDQSGSGSIRQGQHIASGLFLDHFVENNPCRRSDQSAMNGQAASADVENFNQMIFIVRPVEGDVIQSGADDGQRERIQERIEKVIEAELQVGPSGVEFCDQES